jgi:hypothetical protein
MAGVRRDMPDDVQLQAPEVVVEVFCLQVRVILSPASLRLLAAPASR